MLRKRVFAGIAVVVLAFGVLLAPTVQAAGPRGADPGSFWTPLQVWVQDLLADWLGWGTQVENSGPVSTYDALEYTDTTTPPPPSVPLVGPGGESTTNEGDGGDPYG